MNPGVAVEVVPFGEGPLDAYAERLATMIRAKLGRLGTRNGVLVVGHSNTTPALAEVLTGRPIPPIAEGEYGRLVTVVLLPHAAYYVPDGAAPSPAP